MNIPANWAANPEISRLAKKRVIGLPWPAPPSKPVLDILTRARGQLDSTGMKSVSSFCETMKRMTSEAELASASDGLDAWSVGGIRALAGLGMSAREVSDPLIVMSRISAEITTLLLPLEKSLFASVGMSLVFWWKSGEPNCARAFWARETKEQERRVTKAQEVDSINDWLTALCELNAVTCSLWLFVKCVKQIVAQGFFSTANIESSLGLRWAALDAEDNRLEEMSAHALSPGVEWFASQANNEGCIRYILSIKERAKNEGAQAAKRHAKFDVARLVVPKFLADAASRSV